MTKYAFTWGQKCVESKHTYPKTNIQKPIPKSEFILGLDGPNNSLMVQIITLLYKDKNFGGTKIAIDAIHFSVGNEPLKPLNELTDSELMTMLTSSAKLAVDKTNKVLKEKYPKAKKIAPYALSYIKRAWDEFALGVQKESDRRKANLN